MQHLDEGTIHAWLDGALAPNEASSAEAHVQSCEQCARAVAEARGLIAASSRILGALDDVPALQESAAAIPSIPSIHSARRREWRRRGTGYAIAATVLLAAGTTLVLRNLSPNAAFESAADAVAPTAASAPLLADSAAAAPAAVNTASARRDIGARLQTSAKLGEQRGATSTRSDIGNRKNLVVREAERDTSLTVDKVVPLTGAMPRPIAPAAPPPSVRQEMRKESAKIAVDGALTGGAVLQGRVLDAATGAPVAGAMVSLDSARRATRTDSTGKFELQQVPLGQQTVSVRAMGFQAAQHPVAVAQPKDSVELAFALQRSTQLAQDVVVTGAAGAARAQAASEVARREGRFSDSISAERARSNVNPIAGCYVLRVAETKERDADKKAAPLPARIQLGVSPFDEQGRRRALTLEGTPRAQSWRMVGNVLELVWREPTGEYTARFTASGNRWTGALVSDPVTAIVMEPCSS